MQHRNLLIRNRADHSLKEWREKEKTALKLLTIVGELRFDRSIELVFFRRSIYDARPSEILNYHLLGNRYADSELSVDNSLLMVYRIAEIPDLAPCKIDLGKLALEWHQEADNHRDLQVFVEDKLQQFIDVSPKNKAPKDVVLYGFGRIGRLATRRIISETGRGEQLRLKAIVVRPKLQDRLAEAEKRAALLQSDSVHGDFHGTVEVIGDGAALLINGNHVQLIFAQSPEEIDYTTYGIKDALLIDNTGVWRDRDALRVHLRPGIAKIMLTAPGKGVPNVVHGVNQDDFDFEQERIFSAASCTTNAIAPVLKVLQEQLGIETGHVETIHAYTNDQNLLDNFHKKPRRGRGAPVNMVLTTTGAATAVAKVIPTLAGKLTGNAIRVPTPNVSLAILNLSLQQETSVEEINKLLKQAALYGDLVEQIHYSDSTEYVSSNAIGMTTTSVVDAPSTIVSADGKQATVYLWYDNEYGYTCQVIRLAKHAAKVRRYSYY